MKISKERLKEIIKEECGYAMSDDISMIDDEEGRMAKRQLSNIAQNADELDQMLQDETQLEAWVQAKLTKAADYLKTVRLYVEYGMQEGAYDQVIPQNDEMQPEMVPLEGPIEMEAATEDNIYEY